MQHHTPQIDPQQVSPEEWQTRCDLAALYRLLAHFRMTDLIDTHISARVPGEPGHFLINRYGVLFHEMRASDLIKIDHAGNTIDPRYDADSVNRLRFVRRSRNLGFSLEETERLLKLWDDKERASAEVKALALAHVEELEGKIAEFFVGLGALAFVVVGIKRR